MSTFNLGKKLRPANKAWKSFTNILQSKLQKLKTSKSCNETTRRLKSALSRLIRPCLRALAGYHHRHGSRHRRHCLRMNFAAIYVDELFGGPGPVPLQAKQIQKGSTSKVNEMDAGPGPVPLQAKQIQKGSTSKVNEMSAGSSSAAAASSLPRFLGIDERAEEFISKFRKDMKLEREQSILDFQEMLARSA
ncbi:uncharacterized protein LOC127811859 [Diospyros lotus]|uniref:uncharacterized protein LOC127811859 n=1 Tax=Diospyros lotus TaxID=55363 RepID=UPI00224CB78A|nr:uncharacterized protein LOC127811859 [Diospyros lotus]